MDIAVYSGSFNPLHIGHLAIMKYLVDEAGYDCVYLIVSPKNPLKDNISSDSGKERFDAAIAAVNRHFGSSKVKVDDIELNMPEPHYTIRTLDALRQREPENSFTLIIGADNLDGIHRWRDYRRILLEYGVAVYPRESYNLSTIKDEMKNEDPSYKIQVLNAPQINISSTEIREGIAEGRDMNDFLM